MIPIENPKTSLNDPSTSYCSQRREKYSFPSTTDKKIDLIGRILQKPLLCRHDIDDVNAIFSEIDPKGDDHELVYSIIIEKISTVGSKTVKKVQDIISLYHLQRLEPFDADLTFQEEFNNFSLTSDVLEEMATQLPCCDSEGAFEKDVDVLFGSKRSERVERILNKKREKLRQKMQLEQRELERSALEEYPNLSAHLQTMKSLKTRIEREKAIGKMTSSQISTIVIETKEVICQQVNNLPEDKRKLFLIGGTGVGKSTVLCYLRGDKMVFHRDRYVSHSDRNGMIGDDGANSCTFLPNIAHFGQWVFIDFPGFDDTHGPLISLGMELALKALITKNQSNVLVLESITNTEGRFAAVANLGQRLNRIFDNPTNCILGITKVNLDGNFIRIKMLREEEKTSRSAPSKEEKELEVEINLLEKIKNPDLKAVLDEKRNKLERLKNSKPKGKEEIGDTSEIKEHRKVLDQKINELKRQIGLEKAIQFYDLEDEENLPYCMTELEVSTRANVVINPERKLDPHVREVLDKVFMNDIFKLLQTKQDYSFAFSSFDELEQNILDFSLIQTLLRDSNPEIGNFLHLSEMDPEVVKAYDKQVVRDCMQKFINAVISALDISKIEKLLEQVVINKSSKETLKKKITRLQKFIVAVTGQNWEDLRDRLKGGTESLESKFQLPKWLQACCNMPFGIPRGILKIFQWSEMVQANQNELDLIITKSCRELDEMYEILLKLKQIEYVIAKRDELDTVLYSLPISVDSQEVLYQSMNSRIEAIRTIYGVEEWDKHVAFKLDKLKFLAFDRKKAGHVPCLLSHAYRMLERDTSCIFEADIAHETALDITETPFEAQARQRFETIIKELKIIEASLTDAFDASEIFERIRTIHNITQFDANKLTASDDVHSLQIALANLFDFHVQCAVLSAKKLPEYEENIEAFKEEIKALLKSAQTEWLIRSKKIAGRGISTISWFDAKKNANIEGEAVRAANFKWTIKNGDQEPKVVEVVGEGELPVLPYEIMQLQRPLQKALVAATILKYFESLK